MYMCHWMKYAFTNIPARKISDAFSPSAQLWEHCLHIAGIMNLCMKNFHRSNVGDNCGWQFGLCQNQAMIYWVIHLWVGIWAHIILDCSILSSPETIHRLFIIQISQSIFCQKLIYLYSSKCFWGKVFRINKTWDLYDSDDFERLMPSRNFSLYTCHKHYAMFTGIVTFQNYRSVSVFMFLYNMVLHTCFVVVIDLTKYFGYAYVVSEWEGIWISEYKRISVFPEDKTQEWAIALLITCGGLFVIGFDSFSKHSCL